jgi:hypothetical protein
MIAGTLLIGMPGGSEWIFIIVALCAISIMPIVAVVFYMKKPGMEKAVKRGN